MATASILKRGFRVRFMDGCGGRDGGGLHARRGMAVVDESNSRGGGAEKRIGLRLPCRSEEKRNWFLSSIHPPCTPEYSTVKHRQS